MPDIADPEETAKSNRGIALLIAALALALAFSELGGSNADNEALEQNVTAANLWSFYQAKTIRRTAVLTAAEEMETRIATTTDAAARAIFTKRVEDWRKTAARYETEPETNEGRRELMARAKKAEEERDAQKAKGDIYDASSALFQIGIVLASATIITGMSGLAWLAGGLGAIGLALMSAALFAPGLLAGLL